MKYQFILIALVVFFLGDHAKLAAQSFTTNSWKIAANQIVFQSDTFDIYVEGHLDTIYDFSKIYYTFNPDGTYSGKSVEGNPTAGIWSQDTGYLMIDSEVSPYEFFSDSVFSLMSPFIFYDSLGNTLDAISILQFKQITTVPSGCDSNYTNVWNGNVSSSWMDQNNWSMNSVPLQCDQVIIPAGTMVTIPAGMSVTCYTIEVQLNAKLIQEFNSTLDVLTQSIH
ncbi:MAG: hypothetical protein KDC53_19460 [Saprospiraceae bacterium]|nr:hypothetical protein [Saprospiraceae bacterium]